MGKDTDFQKIGKNTLFKVPDGFFDQVSEATLIKAKGREQNRRKNIALLRAVVLVASLAGIAFLGYYLMEKEKSEIVEVAVENMKDTVPEILESEEVVVAAVLDKKKSLQVSPSAEQNTDEKLIDVLANLSDDELQQIAALYKTDPFLEGIQY